METATSPDLNYADSLLLVYTGYMVWMGLLPGYRLGMANKGKAG